ncbi:MAG: N-acetylmuramoyl-L-alanine amidase [Clostridia bacterium]|nr:N-acetylmuramoyl-L-alanine amidase [Clostridia bacterium]
MNLIKSIMTNNPCYTSGRKISVKGLMLHSVGCPQPSAQAFIRNWDKSTYKSACVHGFIDANTGDVYQTLPWNHRGWHGGGSSNNTHIGVEMCEPSCIKYTGGSSFTCSDAKTARACVDRTYKSAVELFAFLCKEFGLNPLADGVIVSHKEGHARGIATNHGDPEHLWNGLNTGYTMDKFRNDVYTAMGNKVLYNEHDESYIGTITASKLNIRKQPSASSDIIGQHQFGDTIDICAKTDNGWYKVIYPNIGAGYVCADYVSVKPKNAPQSNDKAEVIKDNTPDSWAVEAIDNAVKNGILCGDDNGDYKLHNICTRQEIVVFLYRLYKKLK